MWVFSQRVGHHGYSPVPTRWIWMGSRIGTIYQVRQGEVGGRHLCPGSSSIQARIPNHPLFLECFRTGSLPVGELLQLLCEVRLSLMLPSEPGKTHLSFPSHLPFLHRGMTLFSPISGVQKKLEINCRSFCLDMPYTEPELSLWVSPWEMSSALRFSDPCGEVLPFVCTRSWFLRDHNIYSLLSSLLSLFHISISVKENSPLTWR